MQSATQPINSCVPNSSQPIAVFDSGIGGLSIAKCIKKELPNESLIYIADQAYSPYGNLTPAEIVKRVNVIADKLIQLNAKALVIACNTATVNAIDQLRERISIPVIGVEPAIKPAAEQSKLQKVGLLVTQSTAENPRFLTLVDRYKGNADVNIQPCPKLASTIEQGDTNSTKVTTLLTEYLTPLINAQVDTIVLGCTHYPFVAKQIQQICGDHIKLVETALPVTKELIRQLANKQLLAGSLSTPQYYFYSTAATAHKQAIFEQLWLTPVELVNFDIV